MSSAILKITEYHVTTWFDTVYIVTSANTAIRLTIALCYLSRTVCVSQIVGLRLANE